MFVATDHRYIARSIMGEIVHERCNERERGKGLNGRQINGTPPYFDHSFHTWLSLYKNLVYIVFVYIKFAYG